MKTTEKKICRLTAGLLAEYGVTDAVLSPGSRNAPVIMAMAREPRIRCSSVVDERSAAFVALGIAEITGKPVAVVCTSGTALLNFAPAVAEAFYKKLPLVVISADRPCKWIGQDDSQTLRQPGALANFTVAECDLRDDLLDESKNINIQEEEWFASRELNRVLTEALVKRRGPVHINLQISAPLSHESEIPGEEHFRRIEYLGAKEIIATSESRALSEELTGLRVMIVGGFHSPDSRLSKALGELAYLDNVVVIAEPLANVHASGILEAPERLMAAAGQTDAEALNPDVLITFGGALVSARLKNFLRNMEIAEHWHVGMNDMLIDSYRHLTRRIELPAAGFFPRFAGAMRYRASGRKNQEPAGNAAESYASQWRRIDAIARTRSSRFLDNALWSDLKATALILKSLSPQTNLQLGNGMCVRNAMLCDISWLHRVDSNRGVSGIDGCVSTAVGAAAAYKGATCLLVGDMSAQYDMGAFASAHLAPGLKIAVFNNGGGQIFHTIATTRDLPEKNEFFCCGNQLPLEQLSSGYGLGYFSARNEKELSAAIPRWLAWPTCSVLEIVTGPETSAEIFHAYFREVASSKN